MRNTKPLATLAKPAKPADCYVNEDFAAEYLGMQTQTMAVWRLKGCGPAFYKFGRAVRYKMSELDAYAESRRCQSTGEADAL